jgi:hypothetical protein
MARSCRQPFSIAQATRRSSWEDRSILRSYRWLQDQASYQATGDDEWQMHVVNFFYHANMPAAVPCSPWQEHGVDRLDASPMRGAS